MFLLRDGFVKFVPVEVGIAGDEHFEIMSGLEPGGKIVRRAPSGCCAS